MQGGSGTELEPETGTVGTVFPEPRAPQKGPENWCRAKIVEKCRKYF